MDCTLSALQVAPTAALPNPPFALQDAMSLPGLGLAEPEAPQLVQATEYELTKGSEWRFEVAFGKHVQVRLLTGTAEIFGTELVISQTYTFTGVKLAIYTWHGCTFYVGGEGCQSEYTAEETPMTEYANVHFALETLREQCRAQGRNGPRVLILGPENAGKTSLVKMLTGYAIRSARQPLVVNLDPKEGMMSLPGTLTATAFKTLMDVEEGWGSSPMSGPSAIPVKLPLVYYHGLSTAEDKEGLIYKALVSRLALAVSGRLKEDHEAKNGGVIIDTPGSLTSTRSGAAGYEIISHLVSEFAVSAIIVLGSERLYSDLSRRFDGKHSSNTSGNGMETVSVIKLAKSGGCIDRDETFMKAHRAAQIRAYFYGNSDLSNGIALSPRQQQVDFAHLTLHRLLDSQSSAGEAIAFLPGGVEDDEDYGGAGARDSNATFRSLGQIYEKMAAPVAAMRNCVVAVMNADAEADEDDIRNSSVVGFLYVVDVDEAKSKISILAPVAGRIPNRAIVWGRWPEEVIGMV